MAAIKTYRQKYERELFERTIPFWLERSLDRTHGGYFNCLDRDGRVYDTKKHVWLQGRQAWMFAKLYRDVEANSEWLAASRLGVEFLRQHGIRADGRVYFSLTADGKPIYLQRKIFSECFYIMALAEYARAAEKPMFLQEAKAELEKVWQWAYDWTRIGRPVYEGNIPAQSLAVPMILLNVIAEVAGEDSQSYSVEVEECIRRLRLHIHRESQTIYETVAPDGSLIDSPEGRLLNPGHGMEAGWFLQHWAQKLDNKALEAEAIAIVRRSFQRGWDEEYGGIYYFLDAAGYSPTPLEWFMKLWWVHCEALYACLLNYNLTGEAADWEAFAKTDRYIFEHFVDEEYGEWFGYLDRRGEVTHRFKGGPYKGCFHVPRALWLCWRLLQRLENAP